MKLEFLQQVPLFSNLTKVDLTAIAENLEQHLYQKNQLIFRENEAATRMYLVAGGEVKLFKLAPNGKEHILQIMGKHTIIAEVPMFEGGTYPVNCTAVTEAKMFSIARTKLIALITTNPQLALNMLAIQAKKLREFTVKIEQLSLKKTEQKLATYLLNNCQSIENATTKPNKLKSSDDALLAKNTHSQDLANYLGVARETLSRLMNDWIKAELITKTKDGIALLKPAALKKIANS